MKAILKGAAAATAGAVRSVVFRHTPRAHTPRHAGVGGLRHTPPQNTVIHGNEGRTDTVNILLLPQVGSVLPFIAD